MNRRFSALLVAVAAIAGVHLAWLAVSPEAFACSFTTDSVEVMYGQTSGQAAALSGGCPSSTAKRSHQGPITKTIVCGRQLPMSLAGQWNPACGKEVLCYGTDPKTGARTQDTAFGTYTITNGRRSKVTTWCPGAPVPALTTAAIRQQVLRLLPRVEIGSAWSTRALVNAQTILWAKTGTNRSLGTVTIVGRQVALRIGFGYAHWDFGDGATDTSTSPGTPYDNSHPCNTAQCPGYYGHTYTATGQDTITLTVGWHASYSLDDGVTWNDVDPAPLTGPASTHQLQLVQARGVLVPDPGH